MSFELRSTALRGREMTDRKRGGGGENREREA